MKWWLRVCPACRGDCHEDYDDPKLVICFLCGRSFQRADLEAQVVAPSSPVAAS